MVAIGSSVEDEDEEVKSDGKADKDGKAVEKEKSKDEMKVGDNTANDSNPKVEPAKAMQQTDENPQDDKAPAKQLKDEKSKPSQPLIFYLSIPTHLNGWVLSDAIEDIKPTDTNKGALEMKMDRFIEDDCC